jgi:hypothetical protein
MKNNSTFFPFFARYINVAISIIFKDFNNEYIIFKIIREKDVKDIYLYNKKLNIVFNICISSYYVYRYEYGQWEIRMGSGMNDMDIYQKYFDILENYE